MSQSTKPSKVTLIPIEEIHILNPRVRNQKIFDAIIDNIAEIGLKRPITVTYCHSDETGKKYDLICGQGRLEAFAACGEPVRSPQGWFEVSPTKKTRTSSIEGFRYGCWCRIIYIF